MMQIVIEIDEKIKDEVKGARQERTDIVFCSSHRKVGIRNKDMFVDCYNKWIKEATTGTEDD